MMKNGGEFIVTTWKTALFELQKTDMSFSRFNEVKAENLDFNNVSLAYSTFLNVNMSNLLIDTAHLMGANFRNIIIPTGNDVHSISKPNYKPITFENCNLTNTQINHCDLSNVVINNCNLTGLKINGILIEDLLKCYSEEI
jgi:uncharacterized protein YjbI with pentapeptide repeats